MPLGRALQPSDPPCALIYRRWQLRRSATLQRACGRLRTFTDVILAREVVVCRESCCWAQDIPVDSGRPRADRIKGRQDHGPTGSPRASRAEAGRQPFTLLAVRRSAEQVPPFPGTWCMGNAGDERFSSRARAISPVAAKQDLTGMARAARLRFSARGLSRIFSWSRSGVGPAAAGRRAAVQLGRDADAHRAAALSRLRTRGRSDRDAAG